MSCSLKYFKKATWLVTALSLALSSNIYGQTSAQPASPSSINLAPGYSNLQYSLPAIGSYQLPSLGKAADGEVLNSKGEKVSLHSYFNDSYTLLAFIYTTCSDVNGCPLTSHTFYKIKAAMNEDPQLAKQLKLLSLSFDPQTDTPEVMSLFAKNFSYAGKQGKWDFITTESLAKTEPILSAYNQDVLRETRSNGTVSVVNSHILRVFLIDPQKRIRNIYSADFLHHKLLLNDIKTLIAQHNSDLQKTSVSITKPLVSTVSKGASLSTPGDYKGGYDSDGYQTQSMSLHQRKGKSTDLLALANNPPLGLPPLPVPEDNPLTSAKIALGKKLFFDRRLSLNNTFSCAMCHIPEQGFSSNELAMAVGIEGRSVRRNSLTIYNVGYAKRLFHDAREYNLEQQVWGPLLAKNEMGNPSIGYVINKIARLDNYQQMFDQTFNAKNSVTMNNLGKALASYQRSLLSADSPFDRWFYGEQAQVISEQAKQGYQLFTGKAGCVSCHSIGKNSALFTNQSLHNTGIGYNQSMGIRPQSQRMNIAPGIFIDVKSSIIDQVGAPLVADLGLYEITENPVDRWKYRTPSLRNVALSAPYMHNGSLSSLEQVVDFYDAGGIKNPLLDPLVRPLNLSKAEKSALVTFLESLTGSNVDQLILDAFDTPIGDTRTKTNY